MKKLTCILATLFTCLLMLGGAGAASAETLHIALLPVQPGDEVTLTAAQCKQLDEAFANALQKQIKAAKIDADIIDQQDSLAAWIDTGEELSADAITSKGLSGTAKLLPADIVLVPVVKAYSQKEGYGISGDGTDGHIIMQSKAGVELTAYSAKDDVRQNQNVQQSYRNMPSSVGKAKALAASCFEQALSKTGLLKAEKN